MQKRSISFLVVNEHDGIICRKNNVLQTQFYENFEIFILVNMSYLTMRRDAGASDTM